MEDLRCRGAQDGMVEDSLSGAFHPGSAFSSASELGQFKLPRARLSAGDGNNISGACDTH